MTCFCNDELDHEVCWDGLVGLFDPDCTCCQDTARDLGLDMLPEEGRERAFFEILAELEGVIAEHGYADRKDFERASDALKKARAEGCS